MPEFIVPAFIEQPDGSFRPNPALEDFAALGFVREELDEDDEEDQGAADDGPG